MDLTWPIIRGIEGQVEQLPGIGGALASRPHQKIHPTSRPRLEGARIWRRTQVGRGGSTGEIEELSSLESDQKSAKRIAGKDVAYSEVL